MSTELVAILITAVLQSAILGLVALMVYSQRKLLEQLDVNDKVIVLQNRRIEDVVKEANVLMREELLKR
jgi:hypothetical protein